MNDDLSKERAKGKELAAALVEHVKRMAAESAEIRVDGYVVSVTALRAREGE